MDRSGGNEVAQHGKRGGFHLLPDVLLVEHTGEITPPVASRPAGALLQESGIIF